MPIEGNLFKTTPSGHSSWEDFYKARAKNPYLTYVGDPAGNPTSMAKSYANPLTEFVATNPVTKFLVPGAQEFLKKGGTPTGMDVGLFGIDVATPGIPIAAGISKAIKRLIGQPTSYDRDAIRKLADEVIRPSGLTPISDTVVFSKKVMNKRPDGTLSPLFHEKNRRFNEGVWHKFEAELKHPTKVDKKGNPRSSANLAYRPGLYGGTKTPQIKMGKVSGQNRVKRDVAFRNWTTIKRPANQGGKWYLAAEMMVLPRKKKGR